MVPDKKVARLIDDLARVEQEIEAIRKQLAELHAMEGDDERASPESQDQDVGRLDVR